MQEARCWIHLHKTYKIDNYTEELQYNQKLKREDEEGSANEYKISSWDEVVLKLDTTTVVIIAQFCTYNKNC